MPDENPYLQSIDGRPQITPAGYAYLDRIVTDPQGKVYAFTKDASPVMVAAAMARLSRRSGDMRLTYLDEFAQTGEADAEKLIERVVTGYGDDSVQQLIGIQFVVEEASNLLTKQLEWGRYGAYLEQSTRYIYFDQKDAKGRYLYYVPQWLPEALREDYDATLARLFERYSDMVHALTAHLRAKHPEPTDKKERVAWINSTRATACDAIRQALPVATKSTVGIFMSAQAVENLVMNLASQPLQEAREAGEAILREARKITPSFLKRADVPERGGAISAHRAAIRQNLREVAEANLDFSRAWRGEEGVRLVDFWPRREYDLVPHLLFEQAEPLSLAEIEAQVSEWEEAKLEAVFKAAIGERFNRRHRPGRAFEQAHFTWELVGDYGSFRDLQRHRAVDAWQWQRLSPYFGYEVPALVEEAGLREQFEQNFKESAELFERMASAGYPEEAQYATLMGHRMRYRFTMNARALFHFLELRSGPDGHPGYRKIANRMYELFKEAYPVTGAAMRFVNQREDPDLTRMAAEMATQFKLEQLEGQKGSE